MRFQVLFFFPLVKISGETHWVDFYKELINSRFSFSSRYMIVKWHFMRDEICLRWKTAPCLSKSSGGVFITSSAEFAYVSVDQLLLDIAKCRNSTQIWFILLGLVLPVTQKSYPILRAIKFALSFIIGYWKIKGSFVIFKYVKLFCRSLFYDLQLVSYKLKKWTMNLINKTILFFQFYRSITKSMLQSIWNLLDTN